MGLGSVAVGLGSWSDRDICVKLSMVAIMWWCWKDFFFFFLWGLLVVVRSNGDWDFLLGCDGGSTYFYFLVLD